MILYLELALCLTNNGFTFVEHNLRHAYDYFYLARPGTETDDTDRISVVIDTTPSFWTGATYVQIMQKAIPHNFSCFSVDDLKKAMKDHTGLELA